MRKTIKDALHDQFMKQEPVTKADLTGKTVIVTGSNTGLGLEACIHFARMNPGRLILTSRNMKRGTEALERLVSETGCTTAEVWEMDLSDFSSVRAFVERFSKLPDSRLDILIENAGLTLPNYRPSKDGWETTIQVNHLALAYHVLRLLPFMLITAQTHSVIPRIVIVSSGTLYFVDESDFSKPLKATSVLETLSDEDYCNSAGKVMRQRYSVTKLLNVLFTRALATRLSSDKIVIDAVHPGICKTQWGSEMSGLYRSILGLSRSMFAHTTEVGSRQLVFGAIGGQGHESDLHGQYIENSAVQEISDFALSEQGKVLKDRLWNETIEILSEIDPEVKSIITQL